MNGKNTVTNWALPGSRCTLKSGPLLQHVPYTNPPGPLLQY